MKFIDEVKITLVSGGGSDGCLSFRREKFIPHGGPDGGNGGDGGSVYIQGSANINTLMKFRGKKIYSGEHGYAGAGRRMHGKNGRDITLQVPLGTLVKELETGKVLFDIKDTSKQLILKGGRGGLGNFNFKSSTNQAPRKITYGEEQVELEVMLELKLLADIALIGMPNAGKSTLISVVSSAKPKIDDYPFTTIEPNLGVVEYEDDSFVVADIPGLIEDASNGKGLGFKFLKHIERTAAFVHLIDCSVALDVFEAYENYITIREELRKFNEEMMDKKEIICLTKVDTLTDIERSKFINFFEESLDKKVISISSVTGDNITFLKTIMYNVYKSNFQTRVE